MKVSPDCRIYYSLVIIWMLKWEKYQGLIQILFDFIDVSVFQAKMLVCNCCHCFISFKNKNMSSFSYFADIF